MVHKVYGLHIVYTEKKIHSGTIYRSTAELE